MTEIKKLIIIYQELFDITPEQWTGKSREAQSVLKTMAVVHAHRAFATQARMLGYTWREIAKAYGIRR